MPTVLKLDEVNKRVIGFDYDDYDQLVLDLWELDTWTDWVARSITKEQLSRLYHSWQGYRWRILDDHFESPPMKLSWDYWWEQVKIDFWKMQPPIPHEDYIAYQEWLLLYEQIGDKAGSPPFSDAYLRPYL